MALKLDQDARKALARRSTRTGATICVRVGGIPLRGQYSALSAGWIRGACPGDMIPVQCGDAIIYTDERIARYTAWHPITLTARRWGPFVQLGVRDALVVEDRLLTWERTHPDLGYATKATSAA